MAVVTQTSIKNYIGLSSDTKPTGSTVPIGSTFWEYDTGNRFRTYDGTNWLADVVTSFVMPTTFNLQQAAATYDLYTATSGTVYIVNFVFTLPNVNVSDDVNITSISIQTNNTVVNTLLSSAAGAKANLVQNAVFTYATPFALIATKKIQITINGGAADASTLCTVSCRYIPVNPAGYLA